MDGRQRPAFEFTPIIIGLLGIIAGAILVATYHCIAVGCCHRRRSPTATQNAHNNNQQQQRPSIRSNVNAIIMLRATIFKYNKDCQEGMCAVCLSDFNEDDEIRILPECLHIFHVPCIDAWLISHSNCPLCRANTASLAPPHVAVSLLDARRSATDSEELGLPDSESND
ncbi:hypothetical protein SLE2022_075740 [Rubroshorea leprosula]